MINLTEQIERTEFHDAGLEKCISEGDSLRLEFENISIEMGKEEYYSAVVTLSGVREIRRFNKPIPQLLMEGDGEVLQFHKGKGQALLLVEWRTFQPTTRTFAEYKIDYANASVIVEKQDGLI